MSKQGYDHDYDRLYRAEDLEDAAPWEIGRPQPAPPCTARSSTCRLCC